MFRTNKVAMLLSIAVLVASAAMLSSCRLGCPQGNVSCATGISPTYTVPVPPTPTALPAATDPKQLVNAFIAIYGGDSGQYGTLATLFDSAYAKVGATAIACAAENTKETYGGITTSTVNDPVITGTVALVTANIVAVSRSGDANFMMKKEGAGGWLIDSITGWIGGDITPANPVGDSQSCLTPDSGNGGSTGVITGTTGISGTTTSPISGTTDISGTATTPTPLPAEQVKVT